MSWEGSSSGILFYIHDPGRVHELKIRSSRFEDILRKIKPRDTALRPYAFARNEPGLRLHMVLLILVIVNRNYTVLMSVRVCGSIHLKLEYLIVYENSSDEFDIWHCPIKVKVTVLLLPQYKLPSPIYNI